MLPYKIFPMFSVGPFMINMYGIMFATGFMLASLLASRLAKKKGIDTNQVQNLVLVIFGSAIIGARIFYVLFYWPKNLPFKLIDIVKIWEGGLAFYGGFLGAVVAGYMYTRIKKLNFWIFADLLTLPLILGHIFGRLGDYFTGGHPGKKTDLPWAIYLDNAARHPVVLYELIGLLVIGTIIVLLRRKKNFDGFIFMVYIQLYAIQRMVLDFFRIESTDPRFLGLTPTQYLVVILFTLSLFTVVVKRRRLEKI